LTKDVISSKIILYKDKLRKEIKGRLSSQKESEALKKSRIIKKRLFELEEFKKARCVIFFVSTPDEVNTHRMIDESMRAGKVVGVPVVIKGKNELIISKITDKATQFEIGPYLIRQPKESEIKPICDKDIDVALVPGLAFDKNGNRLGKGKGYYDRFLKRLSENALSIGLCFDFQVVESVPTVSHDKPVHILLSNN